MVNVTACVLIGIAVSRFFVIVTKLFYHDLATIKIIADFEWKFAPRWVPFLFGPRGGRQSLFVLFSRRVVVCHHWAKVTMWWRVRGRLAVTWRPTWTRSASRRPTCPIWACARHAPSSSWGNISILVRWKQMRSVAVEIFGSNHFRKRSCHEIN